MADPSRSGASFQRYIVQPKDTLYLIAQRYGVSVEEIAKVNALPTLDLIYPGQALAIPRSFPTAPPGVAAAATNACSAGQAFDVVGYYVEYYAGDNLSWESFAAYQDTISTVAAFSYQINWDGSVSGQTYHNLLKEATALVSIGAGTGAHIGASGGFDRDLVHAILTNASYGKLPWLILLRLCATMAILASILTLKTYPLSDRDLYTAFVHELAAKLHQDGYQVTLSVPAKTWDDPSSAWSGAFDYRALGKIADAIMIMTYDEHWSGGSAGPVASIGWVKQVLDYATKVIPAPKDPLGHCRLWLRLAC